LGPVDGAADQLFNHFTRLAVEAACLHPCVASGEAGVFGAQCVQLHRYQTGEQVVGEVQRVLVEQPLGGPGGIPLGVPTKAAFVQRAHLHHEGVQVIWPAHGAVMHAFVDRCFQLRLFGGDEKLQGQVA